MVFEGVNAVVVFVLCKRDPIFLMLATPYLVLSQVYFLKYSLELHILENILKYIIESLIRVVLLCNGLIRSGLRA